MKRDARINSSMGFVKKVKFHILNPFWAIFITKYEDPDPLINSYPFLKLDNCLPDICPPPKGQSGVSVGAEIILVGQG